MPLLHIQPISATFFFLNMNKMPDRHNLREERFTFGSWFQKATVYKCIMAGMAWLSSRSLWQKLFASQSTREQTVAGIRKKVITVKSHPYFIQPGTTKLGCISSEHALLNFVLAWLSDEKIWTRLFVPIQNDFPVLCLVLKIRSKLWNFPRV